jgi:MFS family permease
MRIDPTKVPINTLVSKSRPVSKAMALIGYPAVDMDTATKSSAGTSSLRRILWCLVPPTTAAFATYNGVAQILIPAQVEHIDPAGKVANLALLASSSTVTALIGLMVGGALSDRTYGRWGRRTPWLVLSAVAAATLLVILGTRTSLPGVAVGYLLLWFAANVYLGALTPVMVDRIPENRWGMASAVVGLGVPLGVLIGVNGVARVSQETGYALLAVFLLATTALLVTCARESGSVRLRSAKTPLSDAAPETLWARSIASLASFRSADFTYAFLGRALILLSFNMLVSFQYYLLQDYIGVKNLPQRSPAVAISILTMYQTAGWVIATAAAGWLAARLDRNKLFVGICSVGVAVAMLIPLWSPTWLGMILFQTLFGIFFGTYYSVDLALISQVLPHKTAAGRDMGIMNMAHLSQLVAPGIAGALILRFGYQALFALCMVAAAGGAVLVFRIRSVR